MRGPRDADRRDFFGGVQPQAPPLFRQAAGPAEIPMTREESAVWVIVNTAHGPENAVPRKDIERRTGLDERTVKDVVRGLRRTHRKPIGALRVQGGGYFLAVTVAHRMKAWKAFIAQAIDQIRTARIFMDERDRADAAAQIRLALEDGDEPG